MSTPFRITKFAATLLLPLGLVCTQAMAQTGSEEGLIPTQMLIHSDSKQQDIPNAQALTLEVDRHATPVVSLNRVQASGVQIALLIDDGLSRSAGVQLQDMKQFLGSLPASTEVFVGYMQNGRVVTGTDFTTDHQAAMAAIRLPQGIPGESASPYFCLSEFVKHWPGVEEQGGAIRGGKARFVMMITNGVDPYNGSTSITNQDSPYVSTAVLNAQRAGVAVSSIYYRDAGFRGEQGSFSGQSYLQQVADGTGGDTYFEGLGNPVSLTPFFNRFLHSISETYVATFGANAQAGGREHLVHVRVNSTVPKLKLRNPEAVRPGNREGGAETTAQTSPAPQ